MLHVQGFTLFYVNRDSFLVQFSSSTKILPVLNQEPVEKCLGACSIASARLQGLWFGSELKLEFRKCLVNVLIPYAH